MDGWTDRPTDRPTDRQTDRQWFSAQVLNSVLFTISVTFNKFLNLPIPQFPYLESRLRIMKLICANYLKEPMAANQRSKWQHHLVTGKVHVKSQSKAMVAFAVTSSFCSLSPGCCAGTGVSLLQLPYLFSCLPGEARMLYCNYVTAYCPSSNLWWITGPQSQNRNVML